MLTADDKLEIQELSSRYNRATDTGDGEGQAATFLPDGTFQGTAHRLEGREQIAAYTNDAWATGLPNRWGAMGTECQHWVLNHLIEGGGDDAAGQSYIALVRSTGEILLVGRYVDTLKKVDGRWYFATRRYEPMPKPE